VVISGLCGGLGRHFGIDPLVFRIAFVVMSLAGGTGLLLYLIGWALVPDDRGNTFGAQWLPGRDRSHKLLAAGLAGVGLLLLVNRITDGHGDDVPLGLVLVGLGAAVLWSRRGDRPPTLPPTGGWTGSGPAPAPPWPPAPPPGDAGLAADAPAGPPPPPDSTGVDPSATADPPTSDLATPDLTTPDLTTPPMTTPPLTTPPPAGSSAWSATTAGTAPPTTPWTAPATPWTAPAPPARRVFAPRGPRVPRAPRPPKPPKPRSALIGVTLSLLAILAGVVALAGVDLVAGLALGLLLVAAALVVGAWRGRARGLIPIAVLLGAALLVASLLDVPFEGGAGERLFAPASVADVRTPYRLVAGDLRLDLHRLDLTGRSLPVVASMATGTIVVTVPQGTAVEVHAQVGAGDMFVFGRDWSGVGIDERVVDGGREGAGRLVLDLHVGFGQLEVRRAAA
jgi:phage shock protein PspC (stress-responsive transcriptional regulator)